MKILALAVGALAALAACTSIVPTPAPAFPSALFVENRGGPAFVVRIEGRDIATVACNGGGPTLVPEEAGVPALPWDLTIVRVRDGKELVHVLVTELPRWYTQIGEDAGGGGLSRFAIAGPPGPTCPASP